MTPGPLPIMLQPALAEEVVLRAIAGHAEERAFRHARNKLYLLAEDDRDGAFNQFHVEWFEQLGLGRPIATALAELPLLAASCTRCLISRSPTRHDEGADLLVAAADGGGRTVLVRVRTTAFDDASQLLAFLRAELLHVGDMVDPAFGYRPALPVTDDGPSHERLLRDRYRVLWDVSVAGRLTRRGVAGAEAEAQASRAFGAAFPMLGHETEEAFRRFFDGEARTHEDFVAFATAPRGHDPAQGLGPGGRCPLCRFPTYAPEPAPAHLPADVIAAIAGDFPHWRAADGLCNQCAELYRARRMSAAAAAMLPGA